jgi:signal transduction histidine kinase/streptogramin lyase
LLACEHEVLLFNTKEKTFTEIPVYDENNKEVSITRVENAAADKKGNVMIMSRTGIFFYDPIAKSCKRKIFGGPDFSAFNQYEIFNVIQDRAGYYWIATNKKGLIRFDPLANKIITISLPAPLHNESLRFDVVMQDTHGNIWAGSSNGVFKIEPATLTVEYFSSDINANVFLSHPEVNVIREDRNHFMWIGTVGGGINKIIPRTSGFKNYDISKNKSVSGTGTYIMSVQQMGDDIWFTNIWDQIGRIDMQTGKTILLTKPLLPSGYGWYSEGVIIKSKKDELIVLNGESQYNIYRKSPPAIHVQAHRSPGLSHIFRSKKGKTYYLVKAAVEKTFHRNDTVFGNQFFYDAIEDDAGNIWIGSSKGLIRFNLPQNQIIHFEHDDNNSNSISSNFIYALEIDQRNENIWMAAYNGGLCSYNIASGKFRHYSKEGGLSDNTVYAIEKDRHDNLWFSTNAGISVYNPTTKAIRNYGVADGLLNHEFNRRSSFKNEEGWLFFGGIFGIDYFHPDSIIKNNIEPNLAFTGFRVFNRDYVPDKNKAIPVIELGPDDRYLTIEFASLDYVDQQRIQFAYRINNNDWIKTGNQRILSFSDLATGSHHLFIRSTDSEGVWLKNEIECLIVVHPEWWQTWWFRAVIGLLGIVITIAAIRLYYRRKLEKQMAILEKQQAVEKERTRIATDIHDDLGSGLSRIHYLGETIRAKKMQKESILPEIEKISRFSDEMVDKMNEIIWALNEKNDTLDATVSYIRSFAVEYLSENNLEYNIVIPENIPYFIVKGETRRNVFLTVKECLHNIVKHAEATQATIDIQLNRDLVITISDNGKGINWDKMRPFSNGILNIKKRMQETGGTVEFKSDRGTMVILKAPLL